MTVTMTDLRDAVRHLAAIESRNGHGGHRGEHAPADCSYCRDWTLAVLAVWQAADWTYGPRMVAEAIIKRLEALR